MELLGNLVQDGTQKHLSAADSDRPTSSHPKIKMSQSGEFAGERWSGFVDELAKIAEEGQEESKSGLLRAAGMAAGGKIMATNALSRYGMKLAPVRRVAQEVVGAGYRAGLSGAPELPKTVRNILAITTDAHLVQSFEQAYSLGQAVRNIGSLAEGTEIGIGGVRVKLGPEVVNSAKFRNLGVDLPQYVAQMAASLGLPKSHVDLISKVPVESTGFRHTVDRSLAGAGRAGESARNFLRGLQWIR